VDGSPAWEVTAMDYQVISSSFNTVMALVETLPVAKTTDPRA
jgi:hypothetical protein